MSRVAEQLLHSGAYNAAAESQLNPYQPPPRSPLLMPEGIPIDVCVLFERLALRVAATGRKRYSSDAILHRIRWEHQIERGDHNFKANDHWTAPLARWFIAKHPDKAGFFETRKLKEERDGQAV